MSAYEKGLARLITRPDLVNGLTIRDRKGGLGTVTVEGGNFVVRLRTDPRPIVYPADAFGTHVLELQMVDQMRLRSALTELGKEKQSAGARALESIASFRAATAAGATTYQPTQVKVADVREVETPTLRPVTRPAGLANDAQIPGEEPGLTFRIAWNLITGPLVDPKIYAPSTFELPGNGVLANLQVVALATAANRAKGVTPGTTYVLREPEFTRNGALIKSKTLRGYPVRPPPGEGPDDELVVRLVAADARRGGGARPGLRVDYLADEVLENFDIVLASVAGTRIPALAVDVRREEIARQENEAARQAEEFARLPSREAPYVRPVAPALTPEARKAQREAIEAAKVGQSERFLLEQTMAARAATPVAVTYADAIHGLVFDKVPLGSPKLQGRSLPEIRAEYVQQVVDMRAAYDAQRAAAEAIRGDGGKAKMPKFPYSILIIEMRNGERAMVDMATGGIRRDVPSEQVTQRLDVILNPPKVGPASVDTRAAQEMRADLARAGHIVEGVGGRRHYSDPLLSEVRGTAGAASHILESYDPRMEGQTRSGEKLLRFRGKSRFAKMLDATPITETSGSRAERAEGMGYGLTAEEVRDMQEAMQITSGVRLTPASSATAFRRPIKLKDDEKPTGEIEFDDASEEYYIIGTQRSFGGPQGRERAIAFLRKIGIPADRIVIYGEDEFDEDEEFGESPSAPIDLEALLSTPRAKFVPKG